MRRVQLDHQAGRPVRPEVFEAMRPFFQDQFGNAASLHQAGLRVRDALARAREQVAAFVGAESPEDILFTSDGTESANLAVKGTAWAGQRRGNHIVTSAIEHPSVLRSVEFLEQHGFTSTRVATDEEGFLDPAAVLAAVTDRTLLVAVHLVNHDVGTIQPVRHLGEAAAERGLPLFVDADAAAGWLPLDVRASRVSLLSFSAPRVGGPQGVGVLYRHRRARLAPLLHGGMQEQGFRAGTENIPGIVGTGLACELAARDLARNAAATARRQEKLWAGLQARIPFLRLNGPPPGPGRSPAQLNVSVEFVEGEGLMLMLDTRGMAVASGTSCASKALQVSPVLTALGVDHSLAQGSILLSLGPDSTDEDVDTALELLPATVERLRALSPRWEELERGTIDSLIQPRGRPGRAPRRRGG